MIDHPVRTFASTPPHEEGTIAEPQQDSQFIHTSTEVLGPIAELREFLLWSFTIVFGDAASFLKQFSFEKDLNNE